MQVRLINFNSMETKNVYTAPLVERIELDNEIALQLESGPSQAPPTPPGEARNSAPEYFNNDPFKTNQA